MSVADPVRSGPRPSLVASPRRRAVGRRRLRLAEVALLAALGVLVVAGAFTVGRLASADVRVGAAAYWVGQLLVVVPAAARLLSRRERSAAETAGLVVVLVVAEYLVNVCYSPTSFTFPDELQHWRTASDILATGHLFTVNHALPVSPEYPGLENVTTALVSLTGLPLFVAGLVVVGVAHLAFVGLVYLIFTRIGGSSRLAGAAVLVYAANPHFASFDSMFVYGAIALLVLALALLAARRLADGGARGSRAGWAVAGLLAITATVVSHHVTAFALVLLLLIVAVVTAARQGARAAAWPAAFTAVAAGLTTGWLLLVAPETAHYLGPSVSDLVLGVHDAIVGGTASGPPATSGPLGDRALAALAALATAVLLPLGWRRIWRTQRRDAWAVALAGASATWFVLVAMRLVTSDGAELAGRASTFVYLPVGYVVGVALVHVTGAAMRRRTTEIAAVAIVLVLVCNGLANGWPPYWERLPGSYQAGGFERSVSPQGVQAARWAYDALGPGNRFAADLGNYTLLGTYGDQAPVRDVAPLFSSAGLSAADITLIRRASLRYVMTDNRLTRMLPVSGRYFPVDAREGRYGSPLSTAALDKYDHIPGVSRVYDAGDITVYDLRGARYAS